MESAGALIDGRMIEDSSKKTHPTYKIQKLWEHHKEILRLTLLGYKGNDVAAILGISYGMVSVVKNSQLGRRHLSIMSAARDKETIDVARQIREMVPKALQVYNDILDEENTKSAPLSLRFKAATEVLDRESPKVTRTENIHAHFTAEEIEEIKNRARKAGVIAVESEYDSNVVEANAEIVDGP